MVIEPGNTQLGKANTQGASATRERPTANTGSAPAPASAKQDSVSLSREAQTLGRLEASVQSRPEVDEAKVASVRQALAEGRYQIDSEAIAGKMLEQDNNL